jgi:NAD(P)-dependent dehydrogenase (short-subunit alcohol dehydrogenase family)
MPPEALGLAGYQPAPDLLREQVVMITGAGDGLGRATALACAAHGATVVLLGRTVKKLEGCYDAIVAAGGSKPAIYPMNLAGASWQQMRELGQTLEREFGRLDGLVHAAAHFSAFSPLGSLPPKDWLESLQVNLTAPYVLTRECLPALERSKAASVIFLLDRGATEARAFRGGYGVAKYALSGMVRMWSQELGGTPQIRINAFDPGPLRTALRRRGFPGEDPIEVPEAVSAVPGLLYLLGPESGALNGECV